MKFLNFVFFISCTANLLTASYIEKYYVLDQNLTYEILNSENSEGIIGVTFDAESYNLSSIGVTVSHVFYFIAESDGIIKLEFRGYRKKRGVGPYIGACFFQEFKDSLEGFDSASLTGIRQNFEVKKGVNTLIVAGGNLGGPYQEETRRVIGQYTLRVEDPTSILSSSVKKFIGTKTMQGGSVSGSIIDVIGTTHTITATPNRGYLFSHWSGDGNSAETTIQVEVKNENTLFQANFIKDEADDDNDGLSNYDELVIYNSKTDDNDSDDDGILDGDENSLGFSPSESNDEFIQKLTTAINKNPSAFDLVTKSAYDQMVDDMIKAQSANATHYTEGWFYLPNRGWMWTNHSSYPYFYDAEDKDWMYFQSGEEKPRFYRYKTKTWLTIE